MKPEYILKHHANGVAPNCLFKLWAAAAHGKPRYEPGHFLKSFELVRRVLLRMIDEAAVPTKELLERRLFGAA